ncbi:MAG: Na-K-Cl cotransporter [Chlamydiales bacterium]
MLSHNQRNGFGTFTGVFVPNVTMMFGVILFLRLGLVLGNIGIWKFGLVIALSFAFMICTSLSIAMIVTNMRVGGGGVYYLISRSLGVEVGGAIGIALVLSQLISFSLCVSGFSYSVVSLFPDWPVTTVEIITVAVLAILSIISTNFALKTQIFIFILLLVSIGTIFFSQTDFNITQDPPFFDKPLSFWEGFALFYPALTGIEAGMALSGNLKNPTRALSIGNFASLLLVASIYFVIALFMWVNFDRSLLVSDPYLLLKESPIPSLIYMGVFSATFSSALGNLLGAPRMLQMIAEDGIAPEILSRTYGKHQEPRWAITLFLSAAFVLMISTTIDQIIPILSMICLLTYGILNVVAGISELIHNPSWRPTFRCPWQVCIAAGLLAFILMLMIDPIWAIGAIFIVGAIYIFLRSKSLDAGFEDLRDVILFFFSKQALYRLYGSQKRTAHWLPQLIAISRSPTQHEKMVQLSDAITRRGGFLTVASIVPEVWEDPEQLERTKQVISDWLSTISVECLVEVQAYQSYGIGIENIVKSYGIGPLQPNTLMISPGTNFENDAGDLVKGIATCKLYKKNIILFFEGEGKEKDSYGEVRKKIDLWWDPNNRESFELMISLILAMRTSPVWGQRSITLRVIANDDKACAHLYDYFRSLFDKVRIKVRIAVHIEEGETAPLKYVRKYSSQADLVLFPLAPFFENESEADYIHTLSECTDYLSLTSPVMAVTSYDSIDHKEIYRDQSKMDNSSH